MLGLIACSWAGPAPSPGCAPGLVSARVLAWVAGVPPTASLPLTSSLGGASTTRPRHPRLRDRRCASPTRTLLGAFVAAGPDDVALRGRLEVGDVSSCLALCDRPPASSSPGSRPRALRRSRARRPRPPGRGWTPQIIGHRRHATGPRRGRATARGPLCAAPTFTVSPPLALRKVPSCASHGSRRPRPLSSLEAEDFLNSRGRPS